MPLPPPAPRQHLHTRQVTCQGFRREDGLWDVEGHLVDTKTYEFPNHERGVIRAGEPVHEMRVRLTVDDGLVIRAVAVVTEHGPHTLCGDIAPAFQALVGVAIGPGFRAEVRKRVGGVKGCTHIVEMLGPIATTAWQTIVPLRERLSGERPKSRPAVIDTCHALAADGPVVARVWPEYATPKGEK
jgi:hypothetical protein